DDHISLLDLGMVAHVTSTVQDGLLKLILAISEARGDAAAQVALQICERKEDADAACFERQVAELVAQHYGTALQHLNAGTIILNIRKSAAECGYRLPPEMTLIGKALLNLDQVGQTLAPDFDPNESIRRNAALLLQQKLYGSFTWGNFFNGLLEA